MTWSVAWEWLQTGVIVLAVFVVWRMVNRVWDLEWQMKGVRRALSRRNVAQEETNESDTNTV